MLFSIPRVSGRQALRALIATGALIEASTVAAQSTPTANDLQSIEVQRGDTFSGIAARILGNALTFLESWNQAPAMLQPRKRHWTGKGF